MVSPKLKDRRQSTLEKYRIAHDSYWAEVVETIMEYGDEHERFDMDFIISINEKMINGASLSDNQKTALRNIISRFDIELDSVEPV